MCQCGGLTSGQLRLDTEHHCLMHAIICDDCHDTLVIFEGAAYTCNPSLNGNLAQSVEQTVEARCVEGSIPPVATRALKFYYSAALHSLRRLIGV